MATTPEQIDLWRQSTSEHQRLEFKEAKTQFDNTKLYEYCVALSNEGGGYLLLGVANKPPRPVVGTQAFNNTVAMEEKIFQAIGFRVDIEEVIHPDGRVLVFHIPSRPRGTAYHLDGKYLMRSGEALVPMTEDQLRKIFAEGGPDWLEEQSLSGIDAQQVVERYPDGKEAIELSADKYATSGSN
jgi:predicted HTH transcriptional regulator